VVQKSNASQLSATQYIQVVDTSSGATKNIIGPTVYFPTKMENIRNGPTEGTRMGPTDYIRVRDSLSGKVYNVVGPHLFFPKPHEEIVERLQAITLRNDEYIKIVDSTTGGVRVEVGEKKVVLEPNEKTVGAVHKGINIDGEEAVLIRDTSSGQVYLITEPQVFFPRPQQDIMEIRKRIRLEEYQTAILKDRKGKFVFRKGSSDPSFFLGPYEELVELIWSRGLHKDKRDMKISGILDSRPKFMWYELEARTKDNVELVIGLTMRWELQDMQAMIQTTSDATGDICSHARSVVIQAVSNLTLEHFLGTFNKVVQTAVMENKELFYSVRGIGILGCEVRAISCKDPKTQSILQQIIQQNTNRISSLQKQESDNEVAMKKIRRRN